MSKHRIDAPPTEAAPSLAKKTKKPVASDDKANGTRFLELVMRRDYQNAISFAQRVAFFGDGHIDCSEFQDYDQLYWTLLADAPKSAYLVGMEQFGYILLKIARSKNVNEAFLVRLSIVEVLYGDSRVIMGIVDDHRAWGCAPIDLISSIQKDALGFIAYERKGFARILARLSVDVLCHLNVGDNLVARMVSEWPLEYHDTSHLTLRALLHHVWDLKIYYKISEKHVVLRQIVNDAKERQLGIWLVVSGFLCCHNILRVVPLASLVMSYAMREDPTVSNQTADTMVYHPTEST